MGRSVSIHIGTNSLSDHYRGAFAPLAAPERDVELMAGLARERGFDEVRELRGPAATSAAVLGALGDAGRTLRAGDLLVVTFAGHGSRLLRPVPLRRAEADGRDETVCLYDRQLLDDEVYAACAGFAEGVRILLLVDSCHSGSMHETPRRPSAPPEGHADDGTRVRVLGADAAVRTYLARAEAYTAIRDSVAGARARPLRAGVILLSACKEYQLAREDGEHGLFTRAVADVVRTGTARNHLALAQAVSQRTPREQRPAFVVSDRRMPFVWSPPFGG
jgi:uncharacterized caspase-like protein